MSLTRLAGRDKLVRDIKRNISMGKLLPGQRLKSTKELADQYGIAQQTAHMALRALVDDGTIVRQHGRGTFVAPRSDSVRRAVGLLTPFEGHVWSDFASSLVRSLEDSGLAVHLISEDDEATMEKPAWESFINSNPLVVIVQYGAMALKVSRRHPELSCISVDSDDAAGFDGDVVAPDAKRAGYIATRRFIELGHERIGCCPVFEEPGSTRYDGTPYQSPFALGYRSAMREAKLDYDVSVNFYKDHDGPEFIREALERPDRPTAFVSSIDFHATTIVRVAQELGMKVPGDLAIISTYNTPWAEAFGLTSFDMGYPEIAEKWGDLINQVAAGTRGGRTLYYVEPKLVVRTSCGGAGSGGETS